MGPLRARKTGRRRSRGVLAAAAACALAAPAAGHEQDGDAGARGAPPAEPPLQYELPAVGSYALPVIDRVGEHWLLGEDGERAPVLGLPAGGCALVAFVYRSCADASGCPLALASLQRLDRALAGREDLAGQVRLVTVSFDPERDTPGKMAELRRHLAPRGDWRFLTAGSQAQLAPVLRDFGQDAVPLVTADGARTGLVRHVTKVFLVDATGAIRNVYSTGFLDSRLLLRDVETLLASGSPG